MPVQIVDLEWCEPLPSLAGLPEQGQVLALVRVLGRPAGLAWMCPKAGRITERMLRTAIWKQVELAAPDPGVCFPDNPQPVSIIVCTRERAGLLRGCLEALRPMQAEGHEIIVVDNAPRSDSTAEVAARYPYRYVQEPVPGLNQARNRGLVEARHALVAYTDDDCRPDPAWTRVLAAVLENPQVGAATGLVLPFELQTPAQERFEAYCANRRIFKPRVYAVPGTAPSTAGAAGMGANMAFRRDLLEQVGGFDTRFDGGTPTLSGGDTEMFAQILAAGAQIVYRPEALVWHKHTAEDEALRRVIYGYGVGLYAFLSKRLLEDHDWGVLWTAPRWLAGPPLKALWNRLRGRHAAPLDLAMQEFRGALAGPGRYWQVRKQAGRH